MPESVKTILIKKERAEKITKNRHPWIFSNSISRTPQENILPGEIVKVSVDTPNYPTIGYAAYNLSSEIRLRMIRWAERDNPAEFPNKEYFRKKFLAAARRKELLLGLYENHLEENKNYRLIHAESDGIPGLIVDRYGKIFVIQCQTAFAARYREWWVEIIKNSFKVEAIYDKSDTCPGPRKQEGLDALHKGGQLLSGELPAGKSEISEDGFRIKVDFTDGQKTGYYLDLRKARRLIEKYISTLRLKSVLNLFGYTGSFNLYAARGGAEKILHIDSSDKANAIAIDNARINNIPDGTITTCTDDIFDYLNKNSSLERETFDCIILDPPSLSRTAKNKKSALEALTFLNSAALERLNDGGILFTFSCSAHITEEDFGRMIFMASRRMVTGSKSRGSYGIIILEKITQDIDHTIITEFPEGKYLNGAVIQKINT